MIDVKAGRSAAPRDAGGSRRCPPGSTRRLAYLSALLIISSAIGVQGGAYYVVIVGRQGLGCIGSEELKKQGTGRWHVGAKRRSGFAGEITRKVRAGG